MKNIIIYDNIIIGGGSAGLFCGASIEKNNKKTLLIEKTNCLGKKLLISGNGQCNFTHAGDIKDFLERYGDKGKLIRKILYKFSNIKVMEFFENEGVEVYEREDGKVFPKSLKSIDIRDNLVKLIKENSVEIKLNFHVANIRRYGEVGNLSHIDEKDDKIGDYFLIEGVNGEKVLGKNIVIATGGASYKNTGSNGKLLDIINKNFPKIEIKPFKEGLVPIFVENYGFSEISGSSVKNVKVSLINPKDNRKEKGDSKTKEVLGDILFTHKNLSGPAILNFSRYINPGDRFKVNFLNNEKIGEKIFITDGVKKILLNHLAENMRISRGLIEIAIRQCIGSEYVHTSVEAVGKNKIIQLINKLKNWEFTVSGTSGFNLAMVSCGGIKLDNIDKKTMECKEEKGMYFIGEVLDIDGDTGGYNIQFAFSSGYIAAKAISQ